MKRTLLAIIGTLLVISIVGCAGTQTVKGDSGRISIVASEGDVALDEHGYTIIEDNVTGCTVLIVEDQWDNGLAVTTLKCEEK